MADNNIQVHALTGVLDLFVETSWTFLQAPNGKKQCVVVGVQTGRVTVSLARLWLQGPLGMDISHKSTQGGSVLLVEF